MKPELKTLISWIQSIEYEQYCAAWCKAEPIRELAGYWSKTDHPALQEFLKDPTSIESRREMVRFFLTSSLILWTPESFEFLDFTEAEWQSASTDQANKAIDQLIQATHAEFDNRRLEALDYALGYLAHWDENSLEAYQKLSPAQKAEIDLEGFFVRGGFSPEGEPHFDFTDYDRLKTGFLALFSASEPTFFLNFFPENIEHAIEDGEMPALIGIDSETIAIFWFMQ